MHRTRQAWTSPITDGPPQVRSRKSSTMQNQSSVINVHFTNEQPLLHGILTIRTSPTARHTHKARPSPHTPKHKHEHVSRHRNKQCPSTHEAARTLAFQETSAYSAAILLAEIAEFASPTVLLLPVLRICSIHIMC